MFKTLLTGACLAVLLAACASAPQKPLAAADSPRNCVTSGSRVPLGKDECTARGQTYSSEEIRQTGHVGNVAAALRQLDPIVH